MLTLLADWLSLLSLLCVGLFLCKKLALSGGFAPLLGVSFGMIFLQLAGSVHLLWAGAWLLLVLPPAAGCFWLFQKRSALPKSLSTFLRPGLLAFLFGVMVLQAAYALREPRFQTWDEFSHWGVFFKSIFYSHNLAQWNEGYGLVHQSYPQGLPALYALFALLKTGYSERDCFFVVALPLLGVAAALMEATAPEAASKKASAVHLVCSLLAVPLFFWIFSPDTPYYTAYMDAPVGAMLGAGLLLTVLPVSAENLFRRGLAVGLVCAALTTVKEIGTVFGLCVLGIWVLQAVIRLFQKQSLKSQLAPVAAAALPFIGMIACWKIFLIALHRTDDQFSDMGLGYFLQCWGEARTGKDPYFYTIWNNFYSRVRTYALLFGWSSIKLALVFTLLGVVFVVLLFRFSKSPAQGVAPLCMILYWPCYMGVLFYVYIGGMSPYEAERVASFDRYACCFFIGWIVLLLYCLWAVLTAVPPVHLRCGLGLAVSALLAFNGLRSLTAGDAPLIGVTSLPYEDWRDTELQNAEIVLSLLADQPEGKVWVLSADEDMAYQNLWYYQYELLPQLSDVELSGSETDLDLWGNVHDHKISYLVLFGASDEFVQTHGTAFEDNLAAAVQNGKDVPTVYTLENDDKFVLLG